MGGRNGGVVGMHGQPQKSSFQCSHGSEAPQTPILPPVNLSARQLQVKLVCWQSRHQNVLLPARGTSHVASLDLRHQREPSGPSEAQGPARHTSAPQPTSGLALEGPAPALRLAEPCSAVRPSPHATWSESCPGWRGVVIARPQRAHRSHAPVSTAFSKSCMESLI